MELETKNTLVEQIISSNTFSNKEVLKGLLAFIYHASIKGKQLKEIDIAIDYFKRNNDFIPGEDTIVRVNIYKLRQLIEKYYLNEGKNDELRLQIPKGSYAVVFAEESASQNPLENSNTRTINSILLLVLIISLIINGLFTYDVLKKYPQKSHLIWADYIINNKPVNIILGDPFFYCYKDSIGNSVAYRDITINSNEELENRFNNVTTQIEYPYFSKNNVLPLADIISILSASGIKVKLQALSEVDAENIKNSNQIFIANINSFGFFEQFLEKSSIRIFTNPRKIGVITHSDTIFYQVPEKVGDYYTDYSFLVKIPGPNHNIITLIGDFHSSGNKGLSGFLLDQEQMSALENYARDKFGIFPAYFEMIVKVSSYHYSDVKTEVIYFNQLQFEKYDKVYFPEMMN